MQKKRILLVDDFAIVRAGIRMLIEAQPDMEVVGEAKGSRAALKMVCETKPDVTIIDIRMSETSGIKTIEHLLQVNPSTRILVLTGYEDPAYAVSALAAGALGYISKHAATSSMLTAIRSVYEGHCFVDPVMVGPLLQGFLRKRKARPAAATGTGGLLSAREREVLILLAQGYTNRQVAGQIAVSIRTVETYRARIVDKLNLQSRADLIQYAREIGLITSNTGT
jgi:two-component system response regulator NreC